MDPYMYPASTNTPIFFPFYFSSVRQPYHLSYTHFLSLSPWQQQCHLDVSGSSQDTVNGCYKARRKPVNGFLAYQNQHSRVMHWQPDNGGQWVVADDVDKNLRGYVKGSGVDGPAGIKEWHIKQGDEVS